MRQPELLIPAGNMEKLRTALLYGADAVYIGVPGLSLRASSAELSLNDLAAGVSEAHGRGVRVYAAINTFARNTDLALVRQTLPCLIDAGVDALIVSDPGLIRLIRQIAPDVSLHLSTQANTTNIEAVRFWQDQGVRRIVLARELTLERNRRNRSGRSRHGAGNFCPRRDVRVLFRTLLSLGPDATVKVPMKVNAPTRAAGNMFSMNRHARMNL